MINFNHWFINSCKHTLYTQTYRTNTPEIHPQQRRLAHTHLRQWHLIVKQPALGHRALRTQTSWTKEFCTWASNTQTSPKQISSTGHFNHLFIDFNHHIIDFKHCFNDFIIRSLTSILDSCISNIYFRSLINWFQTLIHLFQSIINWFQSLIRLFQTPILWF